MKFTPAMKKRTSFKMDLWCGKIKISEEENIDQTVFFICDSYEYFYQDKFWAANKGKANFQYLGSGSYRSISIRG